MKRIFTVSNGFSSFAVFLCAVNLVVAQTRYVSLEGGHDAAAGFDSRPGAATNLQCAVNAAEPGDLILISKGVYNLAEQLRGDFIDVNRRVTIMGVDTNREKVVIDGGGVNQGFRFTDAGCAGAVLAHMTISNCVGVRGGGVTMNRDAPRAVTITNVLFVDNRATRGGGAHIVGATVTGCTFLNNMSPASDSDSLMWSGGGAIYSPVLGGAAIVNCEFIGNRAEIVHASSDGYGGAIMLREFCRHPPEQSDTLIQNCVFIHNHAERSGGAVFVDSSTISDYSARMIDCVIVSNSTDGAGGCVFTRGHDVLKIEGGEMRDNTAGVYAPDEIMSWGNDAFQSDDYARAHELYDRVFNHDSAPFFMKRAAYFLREQCVFEIFNAVERCLSAGRLDRAEALLNDAEEFTARGEVERTRLDLLRARLMYERREPPRRECFLRRLLGMRRKSQEHEEILERLLEDAGPFAPSSERSEAWFLLFRWAGERGDRAAAKRARRGLSNEPAPDPFWSWRMAGEDWSDLDSGPRRRKDFERISAQAGQPNATITQASGWASRMVVNDLAGLTNAFEQLDQLPLSERMGQVVFIPAGNDLDLRGHTLRIPDGVILAGDRGINGEPGSILRCSHFTRSDFFIILRNDSRLTGLRIFGELDMAGRETGPSGAKGGDDEPKSQRGKGVVLAWDASHGQIDNCEIAWFSRDGAGSYGHYLRVVDCYFHNIGAYAVTAAIYGTRVLIERSRIEWTWQAIAGGRSLTTGYEVRRSVIKDARSALETSFIRGSEVFHTGTAMGHHSDLGGARVHVWGNIFPRADKEAVGYRTVSPRNGPFDGAFAHNNWFPLPYLTGKPGPVREELKEMLQRRGHHGEAALLADYVAGEDYDPREMEIRLRTQLANLWAWRNFYGDDGDEIDVSVWTAPMLKWLMPRVRPFTYNLEKPGNADTVLRLKREPDGKTIIPLAWRARMFPGRYLTGITVKVTGPFNEVRPAISGAGSFTVEVHGENGVPRAESAGMLEVKAELPAAGFYRLDLCVTDALGRTFRHPGFFYHETD